MLPRPLYVMGLAIACALAPSSGQAQVPIWQHLQVGLEISPLAFRQQVVDAPPAVVGGALDTNGGDFRPIFGDGSRNAAGQLHLVPAEIGFVLGYPLLDVLQVGGRATFHVLRFDQGMDRRLSLRLGPFLRYLPVREPLFRLGLELGAGLAINRDIFAVATSPDASTPPEQQAAGGIGYSGWLQLGGQWAAFEDISIDPAVRFDLFAGQSQYKRDGLERDIDVYGYQVTLVLGASYWGF